MMFDQNKQTHDVVIVGSGPAGMSAAIESSSRGLSTVVLDEQPEPGGQIFRAVASNRLKDKSILGPEYCGGADLVQAFLNCGATYMPGATVWDVNSDLRLAYSQDGTAQFVQGETLIIATGALERPMPIPGWTLPGVMTVGSAQILLKSESAVPQGRFALAGTGPLLVLSALQLCRAGAIPAAIIETAPRHKAGSFLAAPRDSIVGARTLLKGLAWTRELRRYGVPHYFEAEKLIALGDERLSGTTFQHTGGTEQIELDTLFLHQGVVPHLNLAASMECQLEWIENKKLWQPTTGETGLTSRKGVYVVGDGAGILGADAAQVSGRLAALAIAQDLRGQDTDQARKNEMRSLARERRFRQVLDRVFLPQQQHMVPEGDDTVVCRCEAVTAGELRTAAKLGCAGINQLKFFSRAGMGPCQARTCGTTVSMLMAATTDRKPSDLGYVSIRSPVTPVPLGQLADLAKDSLV